RPETLRFICPALSSVRELAFPQHSGNGFASASEGSASFHCAENRRARGGRTLLEILHFAEIQEPPKTSNTCPSEWGAPKETTSFSLGIGLSFLRTLSGRYEDGSESGGSLFRQAGGCSAFHPGCQFGHVSGRASPRQRGSGQGCGGDLQSFSNYD